MCILTQNTRYGLWPTGEIVNGRIHKSDEGKWIVQLDGDEYKAKSESEDSAKVKREGDEFKTKNGNSIVKKEERRCKN